MLRFKDFAYRFFLLIGFFSFISFSFSSCSSSSAEKLKIYTKKDLDNGNYVTIPSYEFTDQSGSSITNETFEGQIYITDFFFTSCPTICPRMKSQMKRVYNAFEKNSDVSFLSHSIDPAYDNVERLKEFSDKLEIEASKWHMVTGNRDSIFNMAKYYMVTALVDPMAPGGYAHSGHFVLVDKKGLIRGYYDGTEELDVNRLIDDINKLLLE